MMNSFSETEAQSLKPSTGIIKETKLCIIIDSETPLIQKVPTSSQGLTLGQFKSLTSLQSNHYKFYFKSQDSEFGVVKEEVADDESYLPIYDDRIVAWVISKGANQSSLFEPDTPQYKNEEVYSHQQTNFTPSEHVPSPSYASGDATRDAIYISVQLNLDNYNFLGLTLVGPSDYNGSIDRGIHVGQIARNSVIELDGRIEIGDRILEINGFDLRNMKNDDAVAIFRDCIERRGAISLVVQRNLKLDPSKRGRFTLPSEYANVLSKPPTPLRSTEFKFSKKELPSPIIDPVDYDMRPSYNERTDRPFDRSTYSLPRSITPRSLYATSNLENIQTNIDSRFRIDSRSVYESTTPTSIRQLEVALHCGKDDIHTIYAAVKNDSKSLDIKDREWLKVVVKNAFLGSVLVKWLSRNVYGFGHKREVKRFANQMLSLGLIRSPITSGVFSEKCYYTLS